MFRKTNRVTKTAGCFCLESFVVNDFDTFPSGHHFDCEFQLYSNKLVSISTNKPFEPIHFAIPESKDERFFIRLLNDKKELANCSVSIKEFAIATNPKSEIYSQFRFRGESGQELGDGIIIIIGSVCYNEHNERKLEEAEPPIKNEKLPKTKEVNLPIPISVKVTKPNDPQPVVQKASPTQEVKKSTEELSLSSLIEKTQPGPRHLLFKAQLDQTFTIHKIPKKVTVSELFELSSDVRDVHLFSLKNTKEAIVEIAGDFNQFCRNVIGLCGPQVQVKPSKFTIAQILRTQVNVERERHQSLEIDNWGLKKRLVEITSAQRPIDLSQIPKFYHPATERMLKIIDHKVRVNQIQTIGTLAVIEKWKRLALKKMENDRNEALVMKLLEQERIQRDQELQNKTYECPICFNDFTIDEMYVLDECYHKYCSECLRGYIVSNLNHGTVSQLICPNPDCKVTLHISEVRHLVPDNLFEKYERFVLRSALNGMSDVRWCPKPGCETAMVGDPHNLMMICPSSSCKYTFCFNCKEEWHADSTCEQYQQWKLENSEADARYEKWVQENAKKCPNCSSPIEKNGGCNHMTCKQCSHEFCWLCMAKYVSGHFSDTDCVQFS